jgi:hypothetical protein
VQLDLHPPYPVPVQWRAFRRGEIVAFGGGGFLLRVLGRFAWLKAQDAGIPQRISGHYSTSLILAHTDTLPPFPL